MAIYQKKQNNAEAEDDWLITYADAMTLILCFFVLLIAISEPNQKKLKKIQEQLAEQLKETDIEKPFEDLTYDIQAMISEQMLDEIMSVEETERGIIIEIASSSFFESGKANFTPNAVPVLLDMAVILEDFNYEDYLIEVEGHTDDTKLSGSGKFPSNWELSGARASSVVRFLVTEGLAKERMRVKAFADIQPKVPNIDKYGNAISENREINRRIAIKVERN